MREELLRHLLLRLHNLEVLRRRLIEVLKSIPYNEVVEVTQDITQLRKLEADQRLLSYEQR